MMLDFNSRTPRSFLCLFGVVDQLPYEVCYPKDNRPTDLIIAVLESRPSGVRSKEILDLISAKIDTKAGNPRKVVSSIISGLYRKGRIQKRGELYLPMSQSQQEQRRELGVVA